jgi:hypothetical protein
VTKQSNMVELDLDDDLPIARLGPNDNALPFQRNW